MPRLNWADYCDRHLTLGEGLKAGAKTFALPGDKPHYTRDKHYTLHHIKIEVVLDVPNRKITGTSSLTVSPILDGLQTVELDAIDLTIKQARLGRKAVPFQRGDETLKLELPKPVKAGQQITVSVDYEGFPRRGLYFVGPDEAYPNKPSQAWTQGEDQDTRYWAPCYDFPNQRATSEVIATVPEAWFALSNGILANTSHDRSAKTKTYHWKQDKPHVTYLITLAAGEYVAVEDSYDSVPIQYYVPAGREEDAKRSFGNTPEMMQVFTRLTGARYPWAKYAQITVADFIFGGMENTTATTITDTTLHDARAHIDFSSEPLVAHELAHQWFGDWLTCKDWSHAWLNEGFATYFEALYMEHHLGRDEFLYEVYQNGRTYLSEGGSRYQRPIVTRVYTEPIDLFDRHLYEKGAVVLHMLRYELGDDLFFKSIQRYVHNNKNSVVETDDLRVAIEETTGRTMEAFFDQWVYKAGHPDLKVSYSWEDDTKLATITVEQKQDEKESSTFRFPLVLDFTVNAEIKSFKVDLKEKDQKFHFPLAAKPTLFRFDPGNHILKNLDEDYPKEVHFERLKNDDDCIGRIRATRALGKIGTREAVDALKRAVVSDSFWGVQAAAANALGTIKMTAARDALIECLTVKHPKARRAVVTALGECKDDAAAKALVQVLKKGDQSYFVEASAARALGHTRSKLAYDALVKALDRPSHQGAAQQAVMDGLAELRDPRGLEVAREWARYGKPQPVRGAALMAAAKLGEERKDNLGFITDYLYDPWLRVRMQAVSAMEHLEDWHAIDPLETMLQREMDGRVKRFAREAIVSIRDGIKGKEDIRKLETDLDKLREDNKSLVDRLDKLEANAKSPSV